jgi:hypothetical protein
MDSSAYVWLDYAMIRNILRLMRNLFSLQALLQEKRPVKPLFG